MRKEKKRERKYSNLSEKSGTNRKRSATNLSIYEEYQNVTSLNSKRKSSYTSKQSNLTEKEIDAGKFYKI